MNKTCNQQADASAQQPTILEPEDQERVLTAEIERQKNIIAVAKGYLQAGEPHHARTVLESVKL